MLDPNASFTSRAQRVPKRTAPVKKRAMQESYGSRGLNVYIKKPRNPLCISRGYYHTDNQVHLILQDMVLEDFPHISDPVVSFPLLSNVIKLEAVVSKIIIHASYINFRNTSRMVFDLREQDPYKNSPFLFEQVKNEGSLAITVEGCKLSGIGITSLTGRSVNLGNTVFRLLHCQYDFEIFTPGIGSPPVVANYLPNSEGLNIEHLIMKPLSAELRPKLQAALHSYINTSAVFQESLPEMRLEQEKIFERTTNYLNNVIRNLNVLTITRNSGKILMEDFSINWNDTIGRGPIDSVVSLSKMVLTGLETVYSSHTGGPFKLATVKISDELRFGTLQVRGSIDLQMGNNTEGMFDFAVEISDVEVDITVNIEADDKEPSRTLHVIEVMGWRSFQFSCPGMALTTGEAFITGYLLTKVPVYLTTYLNNILGEAARETDAEYKGLENNIDEKQVLGANVPYNSNGAEPSDVEKDSDNYNTNLDDGGDDYGEDENIDKDGGKEYKYSLGVQEQLDGLKENLEDDNEDDDRMIGDNDDSGIMQGVTSFDGILNSAVTGPGGIVVDEQNPDAPGGIDYGEFLTEDPGEVLKPKFFDENMFDISKNNPDLKRNQLRMRSRKHRKLHQNKPIGRRATRTAKSIDISLKTK